MWTLEPVLNLVRTSPPTLVPSLVLESTSHFVPQTHFCLFSPASKSTSAVLNGFFFIQVEFSTSPSRTQYPGKVEHLMAIGWLVRVLGFKTRSRTQASLGSLKFLR